MAAQHIEWHHIQRPNMRRLKTHAWCAAFFGGLHEASSAQAPWIAGFEPGKSERGLWG